MPLARELMDQIAPQAACLGVPWCSRSCCGPALDEQAASFARSRREWSAARPRWLRVPGGRVLHAMVDGETVPICGVVPVRADGTVSPWHESWNWSGAWHRQGRRHKQCQRLASRRWVEP